MQSTQETLFPHQPMVLSLHQAALWIISKLAHSPGHGTRVVGSSRQVAGGASHQSLNTSKPTTSFQGTNTEWHQGQAHLLTDLFLLHLQLLQNFIVIQGRIAEAGHHQLLGAVCVCMSTALVMQAQEDKDSEATLRCDLATTISTSSIPRDPALRSSA